MSPRPRPVSALALLLPEGPESVMGYSAMDDSSHRIVSQVAYIDTEGTFRPDRIKAIADRFGADANAALENVVVARAHNVRSDVVFTV